MKTGVILMTYGSPKTLNEIPKYLKNIYKKSADPKVIKEFRRRYSLIGGSPLIEITKNQASALEKKLNTKGNFKVAAGMRFSKPFIKDEVKTLSQDCNQIIGIIMSPQYSPIIMKGYSQELRMAVSNLKNPNFKLKIATNWYQEPDFLKALAQKVKEALEKIHRDEIEKIPILFSAHSMPKRVVEKELGYINSLKETAEQTAKILKLSKDRWMFCYQSAGHAPEEWLKPDFSDLMPILKKQGHKSVLIAPVQFLADHLEILYDIDIGAREQAEQNGLKFYRTESLNTSPFLINALAKVVKSLTPNQ